MEDEGAVRTTKSVFLGQLQNKMLREGADYAIPEDMYIELMWGYAAAVSFADYQASVRPTLLVRFLALSWPLFDPFFAFSWLA